MPSPDREPSVTLTNAEKAWAVKVGVGRAQSDETVSDATQYKNQRVKVYTDLAGSVIPCLGEIVVAKHLNQHWAGPVWRPEDIARQERLTADVGPNIEVRHITSPNKGLVVREKDITAGKTLVLVIPCDPDFRQSSGPHSGKIATYDGYFTWRILGMIDAATGWEIGDPDYNYRRVPREKLLPVDDLQHPPVNPFHPGDFTDADVDTFRSGLKYWDGPAVNTAVRAVFLSGDSRPAPTVERDVLRQMMWARVNNVFWIPAHAPALLCAATRSAA